MKKKITYYERYISNFRCVETQREAMVLNVPPQKHGDLYYFKLDEFSYLVLYIENGKWYR